LPATLAWRLHRIKRSRRELKRKHFSNPVGRDERWRVTTNVCEVQIAGQKCGVARDESLSD